MQTAEIIKVYGKDTVYLYRATNMQASSARYGVCKECGEYASEVYLQTEYEQHNSARSVGFFWKHNEVAHGHLECIRKKRKSGGSTKALKKITIGQNTWIVGE